MKVALITGITGQDGSYLAELLIKKGYIVHGVKRRSSSLNTKRIDHLYQDPHEPNRNFILHYGDITDSLSVSSIIKNIRPNEIYNLAAQSHVAVSFEVPELFGKGEIFQDLSDGGVITPEPEFEQVTVDIKEQYFNDRYLDKINRTFEDFKDE